MENTIESEGLEGTEWMARSTMDESPQEWGHEANGGRGTRRHNRPGGKEENRRAKDRGSSVTHEGKGK